MIRVLVRIEDGVGRLEAFAVFMVMASLVAFMTLQIISRYVLPISAGFTEELVRILLVWLCFLGAAHASYCGQHFLVPILMDRVGFPGKKVIEALVALVFLSFLLSFIWASIMMGQQAMRNILPILGVPLTVAYASFVVGGSLMAYHLVMTWVRAANGIAPPDTEGYGQGPTA